MSDRRLRSGLALLALGVSGTAPAANFDYQLTAGAAHSDNVTRVADDKQDEDIANAGLRFSFDSESRKTKSDLVGNFEYQKFLDDTYDPQLIGNFSGNLQVAFVPERFIWNFADNFGQVQADPLLPSTPQNSENINFFSTGPDATFAFGAQNRLKLGARYLRTDYQDSPFDSTTTLGEAGFARILSSVNTLSLNVRVQQVDYETAAFSSDYDQTDTFVRYEGNGARTKISADAGYSDLQRDVGADSKSAMLRLSAVRQIARASSLTLLAGREFANSGSAFAATQGNAPITLDPTAGRQTPQPFLRDYATLSWMFQKQATTISLHAGFDEQDYEFADALDQKFTSYGAFYRRDLSAASNLQVDAARTRGTFRLSDARYTDTSAGIALNWGISRTLSLSLSYRYADRNGDALTGDYTENRVSLSIAFRRGAPRVEALRPTFGAETPRN